MPLVGPWGPKGWLHNDNHPWSVLGLAGALRERRLESRDQRERNRAVSANVISRPGRRRQAAKRLGFWIGNYVVRFGGARF